MLQFLHSFSDLALLISERKNILWSENLLWFLITLFGWAIIGVSPLYLKYIRQSKQFKLALKQEKEILGYQVELGTAELKQIIKELRLQMQERTVAEEALRSSEERFRAIFSEAAVGISHTNIYGRILRSNRKYSDIVGYTEKELLGLKFQEITHPEDLHEELILQQKMLIGKIPSYTIEKRYIRKDRSEVWINLTVSPIYDNSGKPLELIKVVEDISARKLAEKQLLESEAKYRELATIAQEQATKLEIALEELADTQAQLIQTEKMSSLGQLVAGICHEINNSINFIYGNIDPTQEYTKNLLGLVELYQRHYPHPPAEIETTTKRIDLEFIKEDIQKIFLSMFLGAERIRKTVLSLRNFSRLDEAEKKAVDIHEGIDNTILILENRLNAKYEELPIEVVKEYGDLPVVECCPGQLNQVFANILHNAIDAIEESFAIGKLTTKGKIWIRTGVENNQIKVSIIDNGIGMNEEVKYKIFDPFFTTKPVGSGTGLGMSISYKIVEKHGGKLQCFSTPGQGTEFILSISH
jgi:two-component system, NtrC family, sensor kinase